MIYADNAATTAVDSDAFEAMKPFLLQNYGNASQAYSFSRTAKQALQKARATIAKCINAEPEEIYFTSCGTEGDNWALKGLTDFDGRSEIITSCIEHHAILNSCTQLQELGKNIVYLPVDGKGIIQPEILKANLTDKTKLVSVMLVNNEIGTIEPIAELAKMTHAQGAYFHTDAVQAVGHIPIDVKKLEIDMLSASGHKFNSPKGIGFLYIKKGVLLRPFLSGGAQERRMRAGTENVASIVAMAVALEKNCAEMAAIESKLGELESSFFAELDAAGIDYIRNGATCHAPGNISVSFKGASGEMLLHRLDLKGICVSTGSACDSQNTQVSHVLQAIHLPLDYAKGTIRISFGRNNDVHDGKVIAKAIVDILK